MLRWRGRKPLKSLGTKSRDFAESFVFKQLIACRFRRFPGGPFWPSLTRFSVLRLRARPHIIAPDSEIRKDLSASRGDGGLNRFRGLLGPSVLTREPRLVIGGADMTPALRIIRNCIITR